MIEFNRAEPDVLSTSTNYAYPTTGSVCFWFTPTDVTGNNNTLFAAPNLAFNMRIGSSGIMEIRLRRGNAKTTNSVTTFVNNTRYHIVGTYTQDGVNTSNTLYVNGLLDVTGSEKDNDATVTGSEKDNDATVTGSEKDNDATGSLYIGAQNTANPFSGTIEDFRIYDRQLSAEEAATMYACEGHDGIRQGLLNRWRMNELSDGTTVANGNVTDDVGGVALNVTNTPVYRASELSYRRRSA